MIFQNIVYVHTLIFEQVQVQVVVGVIKLYVHEFYYFY